MNKMLNWVMLVSLVMVFVSGMMLKPMPGMWLGILHGVSGLTLVVSVMVHVFRHARLGRKVKSR